MAAMGHVTFWCIPDDITGTYNRSFALIEGESEPVLYAIETQGVDEKAAQNKDLLVEHRYVSRLIPRRTVAEGKITKRGAREDLICHTGPSSPLGKGGIRPTLGKRCYD